MKYVYYDKNEVIIKKGNKFSIFSEKNTFSLSLIRNFISNVKVNKYRDFILWFKEELEFILTKTNNV